MTKSCRRQHTKDETEQQEQLKLLEQFKREWRDRTSPADRFSITPPIRRS